MGTQSCTPESQKLRLKDKRKLVWKASFRIIWCLMAKVYAIELCFEINLLLANCYCLVAVSLKNAFSLLLGFLANRQLPRFLEIRLSRHWDHYFGFSPIKQLWSAGFHKTKIFLVSRLFWFSTFSIQAQDLKQPLTSSFRRGLILLSCLTTINNLQV